MEGKPYYYINQGAITMTREIEREIEKEQEHLNYLQFEYGARTVYNWDIKGILVEIEISKNRIKRLLETA
jgi:hypothetical protein